MQYLEHRVMVINADAASKLPGFEPQVYLSLSKQPETNYLLPLLKDN